MTKVQIKSHTPHSFCRNIFYCGALDAPFGSSAVIRMRFRKLLYCYIVTLEMDIIDLFP